MKKTIVAALTALALAVHADRVRRQGEAGSRSREEGRRAGCRATKEAAEKAAQAAKTAAQDAAAKTTEAAKDAAQATSDAASKAADATQGRREQGRRREQGSGRQGRAGRQGRGQEVTPIQEPYDGRPPARAPAVFVARRASGPAANVAATWRHALRTAACFAIHRVSGFHCSQSCSPRERGRSNTE